MSKVNNLKFGKKFIAGLLVVSLVGGGIVGGLHLHKKSEINRVKGYLEDFLTEDNYVDLSKVTSSYDIKGFDGEYLDDAMEEVGVSYVRLTDTYVYDGKHVVPFKQMNAVNYNNYLWTDKDGNDYYEMYEPIRCSTEDGVVCVVPEGFQLEEIEVIAEPFRYDRLEDTEIVVRENDYDDSYSLSLERKK